MQLDKNHWQGNCSIQINISLRAFVSKNLDINSRIESFKYTEPLQGVRDSNGNQCVLLTLKTSQPPPKTTGLMLYKTKCYEKLKKKRN